MPSETAEYGFGVCIAYMHHAVKREAAA